jgi:hypothetical protein
MIRMMQEGAAGCPDRCLGTRKLVQSMYQRATSSRGARGSHIQGAAAVLIAMKTETFTSHLCGLASSQLFV